MKRRPAALLVVAALAIAGCGGDPDGTTERSAHDDRPVALTIRAPENASATRGATETVRGTATPGATVAIDDAAGQQDTADSRGRWSIQVEPELGSNEFRVRARIDGRPTASQRLVFTRNRTAAERARYAREKAREEAGFKARASPIDYGELEKSPSKHTGTEVVFTGQIAEIFEEEGRGVMRLQVTNQGYDIWDDDIWVNYETSTHATRDDVVTVYGTMTGVKTYETQIGGERSIPEMAAKYIEE